MTRFTPMSQPAGSDSPPAGGGLSSEQARARLAVTGPNALPDKQPAGIVVRLARQFASPLIYILLFALAVDLAAWWHEGARGWPLESIVITAILIMNAALGAWQESKAEAALARLHRLAARRCWALRDGEWRQVDTADLTHGDLARVEAGDRVPADGLTRGPGVSVDESILTGESLPVEKQPGDEMLSGTLVVRGRSFLEVVRTGRDSSLGRLAGMLEHLEQEATPLERRLKIFGARVARGVLILCAALMVEGLLIEGPERWSQVLLFAVALGVAAVPEGLPAVMTLTLALGVERMAARKAVVRRLSAVEALGSVTVILTDKTGTLTANRMEVRGVEAVDEPELLLAMVLANDADGEAGDPIDLALSAFALSRGVNQQDARRRSPRLSSRDFDSERRFQTVTVAGSRSGGGPVTYLKGAPEAILARCALSESQRQEWLERAGAGAAQGHRVLGAAQGAGESESGLRLLGLIHLWDPLRPGIATALEQARQAGIRVVMVTGDHPATAQAIASLAGLDASAVVTGEDLDRHSGSPPLDAAVYARVRPEHKLQLVEAFQRRGEVVAMTGDGVNDAPALKRADVGIAMGLRGSDVSREVADIVLLDDNIATIVAAIEEGRGIYENIQKFIRFLFSTNLAEIIVISSGVTLSAWLGLREPGGGGVGSLLLPLTAVQILWINLVTDGLPALALAFDRNPGVMSHPPHPKTSPLLDRRSLRFVVSGGLMNGLLALGILGLAMPGWVDSPTARSAMFQFLAICQLFYTYPSRHTRTVPLPNPLLHAAAALGIGVQLLAGTIPGLMILLGLVPLSPAMWGLVFGCSILSWLLAEFLNRVLWRR